MDYAEGRNNGLNISTDELNRSLTLLVKAFSKNWLTSQKDNPVQLLWNRKDGLSTNELYSLAEAIKKMREIDNEWVSHKIKIIKGKDENNRKGALFELFALSFFAVVNAKMLPSKRNTPGVDGHLIYGDGSIMNISIKSYYSGHYDNFLKESKKIEKQTERIIKERNLKTIQITVLCSQYPKPADWKLLNEQLGETVINYNMMDNAIALGPWTIFLTNLDKDKYNFSAEYNSYKFINISPYHSNEMLNLISKLDEAFYNLYKHSNKQDSRNSNAIFIHLPVTASLSKCLQWASDYFDQHTDNKIFWVLFYQPSVATNEDKTVIHHYMEVLFNKSFTEWDKSKSNIELSIPVGLIGKEPSKTQFHFDNKTFDVENYYIYQSGNYYTEAIATESKIEGNVSKIAPGILNHCVLNLPNSEKVLISGKFSPYDSLLIL